MPENNIKPLFLFSLPRSGSTLLQRALNAHPKISTRSEPWIMLPLLYARRPRGVAAEYNHVTSAIAISEFAQALPEGQSQYNRAMHDFALNLYRQQSHPDTLYFLDKTPRYSLIAEELVEVFPDAKFVFLWRNPLATAASFTRTWGKNAWRPQRYRFDFQKGLPRMQKACHMAGEKAFSIRYEDLVSDYEASMARLWEYLEIDPVTPSLSDEGMRGNMGDRYQSGKPVSQASLEKWKSALCNPLRRQAARKILHWIGPDVLAATGYDMKDLKKSIRSCRGLVKRLFWDMSWRLQDTLRYGLRDWIIQDGDVQMFDRIRKLLGRPPLYDLEVDESRSKST